MPDRRILLKVPEEEAVRWEAEAFHRHHMAVDLWVRRAANLVLRVEREGKPRVTGHQPKLASLVTACEWCATDFGPRATVRKRFCSDSCRVVSWRAGRQF